ncbi:hypothetical protein HanRHA438_Chr06g0262061 [Helianthus annuus]|nr:hypothetical protein HanRHA438_Chr06g0262061 [Helianthus annuus]
MTKKRNCTNIDTAVVDIYKREVGRISCWKFANRLAASERCRTVGQECFEVEADVTRGILTRSVLKWRLMLIEADVSKEVYDWDILSSNDKMGDAEFDFSRFLEAVRMNFEDLPNDTIITTMKPMRTFNRIKYR